MNAHRHLPLPPPDDFCRPVILMTGFEPFATFARNPSFDALARAAELGLFVDVPADVEILELPVVYGRAFDVFVECVERVRPIAAVSLGVHFGGQTRYRDGVFYPECLARNFDGPTRPDNAGVTRPLASIVPGAPEAVPSPMAAIVAHHLQSAGYSANISDDAGAYLCNHIFYTGMHALNGRGVPFGFVHVPPSTDVGGTISPDALAAAMPIIAHAVIAAAPGITRP